MNQVRPAVDPTLVIVGLNRSGTTALSHAFLNHPDVELFKDPGKYRFESTGEIDFSHFFCPPITPGTTVRVIKQSIGQYTPELCTIPIYPMLNERPAFLRRLHHLFLVRRPIDAWSSWEAMTEWARKSDDGSVRESWRRIVRDKGIPVGWGTPGLFDLAFRYFYQTYLYVRAVAPESTYVVDFDDLTSPARAARVLERVCARIGLSYLESMVQWPIKFEKSIPRRADGFRRPLSDPERQYIHRTILRSRGLADIDAAVPSQQDPVVRPIDPGLMEIYAQLRAQKI